jgi:hypothetical protein
MKTRLFLLLTTLFALAGCSSGGTASGGNGFGLTGAWGGIMKSFQDFVIVDNPATPQDESGIAIVSGNVIMNIVQDVAGTITGVVTVSDPESGCWTGGSLTESSLAGNNIVLNWTDQSGATVNAQGTATSSSINALYTSSEGTCPGHSGTFNVNR